jgi:CRISPR-associated protein Cas2
MDVLVTYDINTTTPAGERRLLRVARVCEGYGERVQYSVFECRLGPAALERLISQLQNNIEPATDSVNLYRFSGTIPEARLSLGRAKWHDLGKPWIL